MIEKPQTPLLTVDVIVEVDGGVVLIERRNAPEGWALPGGFVDVGESVERAAVREAREETSLDVLLEEQFLVYSDPSRDARGHTASVVFFARAAGVPKGADDAKRAQVFRWDALPSPLCFDHAVILRDARVYRAAGLRPRLASR
jgi:8-oxo-dGTP diphosphatase